MASNKTKSKTKSRSKSKSKSSSKTRSKTRSKTISKSSSRSMTSSRSRTKKQKAAIKIQRMTRKRLSEKRKQCLAILKFHPRKEPFDLYTDQYHLHQLTVVSDCFMFKEVSHSVRDYMPNCETDYR